MRRVQGTNPDGRRLPRLPPAALRTTHQPPDPRKTPATNIDPSSGSVFCGSCSEEGSLPVSGRSAGLLEVMKSNGTALSAGLKLAAAEKREIGKALHSIFAHHVDGYRLPGAFRILKGVDKQ